MIGPDEYNHNKAEAAIRELKQKWYQVMVPKHVWDYRIRWVANMMQHTVNNSGRTPIEQMTGETPDLSEFSFYELVYFGRMLDWVWGVPLSWMVNVLPHAPAIGITYSFQNSLVYKSY